MLDDHNVLNKRDSEKTLESAAAQYEQLSMPVEISDPEHDHRDIKNIVYAGMGGSALAPEFIKAWLSRALPVPIEIVKSYDLPAYANAETLVLAGSCSGDTEEALSIYDQARKRGCQVAAISGGGKLIEVASADRVVHIKLPAIGMQPRMLTFVQVRAVLALLEHFGIMKASRYLEEMADTSHWLREQSDKWSKEVSTDRNYAKQLALTAVGKTPVIYGGYDTRFLAYKWKISFNENSKNIAFCNYYPESSHNEFIGWTSHPIEKPFVIFDLISDLEHPQILKRFEVSDRLLSGKRPKANPVHLPGETLFEKLVAGQVLAEFVTIYTGILNNVDPGPTALTTKLKQELA